MFKMLRWVVAAALMTSCGASGLAFGDAVELSAAKDNTLYEDPKGLLSNGSGDYFFAGNNAGANIRRGLIAFDLSSIPAGSTIHSVTLKLHMSRSISSAQSTSLHRVTQDWGEGLSDADSGEGGGAQAQADDATWLHTYYDDEFWVNAGGDFEAAPSATIDVGGIGFYTWGSTAEMVADVQAWVDNGTTNFGWILLGNESDFATAKRFDSRSNPISNNVPVLSVDFTLGSAGPICPDAATILRGLITSGGFADVCESDDVRWLFRPDALAATVVAPINVVFDGTYSGGAPIEYRMQVEVAASHAGVVLRFEVFNFATDAYESQIHPNIPTTDTTFTVTKSVNPQNYIGPNGEIRGRVSFIRPAGVPPLWSIGIDALGWEIDS